MKYTVNRNLLTKVRRSHKFTIIKTPGSDAWEIDTPSYRLKKLKELLRKL